ncbi:MAG: protein phosphatase CheZ [Proteobacteria bacterium]|nr:protein phosphatase CheZ [Pseudomonadota bacterium]MBU0966573.1 protein phosphatase CheZ [Pseudomonadota bacterium]
MSNKPEIYLEIGASFFRIPTPEANYNITVLGSQESSVTRVVEKIVEKEKEAVPAFEESAMAAVSAGLSAPGSDDFYRDVSSEIYRDIGQLAKSLSVTIMDIPAEDRLQKRVELDEAGDKIEDAKNQLKDIVEMTERAAMKIMDKVEDVQGGTDNVKNLLSSLKNHPAFSITEPVAAIDDAETGCPITQETEALQQRINQAIDLLTAMQEEGGAVAAPPEVKKEKKTRYLFNLDVVFQTLYELCTNEAVKEHITKARGKAADLFELDTFHDTISTKAAKYEADSDNFYTVPMSDVFASLFKACKDKGIANLLKKMDAGQSSIFLDQTIPLEVPPIEEIEVESAPSAESAAAVAAPPDPRIDEVKEVLAQAIEVLATLPEKTHGMRLPPGCSTMTLEDQREIFKRIEDAFGIAANISSDVSKITEALSFQDLSGQQIMKIIKLLSDFQIQLIALVVSFGSQLKHKEMNKDITLEESKKLAQDDVDSYINKLSGTSEEGGMLDQLTVNKMLEEMGF